MIKEIETLITNLRRISSINAYEQKYIGEAIAYLTVYLEDLHFLKEQEKF